PNEAPDMMRDDLKRDVWQAIDRRRDEIIGLGEQIRRHPELGFKEIKTSRLVEETLGKLGLSPRSGLAVTGVRADLPGRAGDGPPLISPGDSSSSRCPPRSTATSSGA